MSRIASDTVSVIDTATNTVVGLPITVGFGANAVADHPGWDTRLRHEYGGGSNSTVSVIRTATKMVVKTIPVGNVPGGVAVSPDGTHVYVANNGSSNVSVIARPGDAVVANIPVGTGPMGVAIGP